MSTRTIVALVMGAALVFAGVFYVVMRTGGEDDATKPTANATDPGAESRSGAEPGGRVGAPAQTGDTTAIGEQPVGAAIKPGEKAPAGDEKRSAKGDTTASPGKTGSPKAPGDAPEPKEPKEPSDSQQTASAPKDTGGAKPTTPAPTATEPPKPAAPPPAMEREFDRSAASSAMSAAASRAMGCKGDGPAGTAQVSVTFAPSGRVTSARVDGPPFSGTPTGGCIATAFRSATVPPFDGSPVTVRKTVSIR